MRPFFRYELRTKDPDAARAFYATLLGAELLDISRLPERAAAAGAPSHWLGHLEGDLDRALSLGAERIHGSVLRDPLGAVFAVGAPAASPTDAPPLTPVVWHQLNTTDPARARAFYASAFDWPDDVPVTITDLAATQPGVHAAWLFHLRVPDLERAVALVKEHGGLVAGVFELPGGDRLAVCEDPQGAFVAFRA